MRRSVAPLAVVAGLCGCLASPPGAKPDAATGDAGPPGLVAWYPMDEVRAGGVVQDDRGAHDAACESCPSVTDGVIDSGLDFDGDAHLVVEDHSALRTSEGTITVWAALDAVDAVLVTRPVGGDTLNDMLLFTYLGAWAFYTRDAVGVLSKGPAVLDTWQHVAVTWSSQRNSLYIDGELQGVTVSPPAVEYQAEEVLIGINRDNTGEVVSPLEGRLDDLRFYDRVLGDDEIAALAAAR